jgi:glycosyltransferase involved in cell wall biosynthesis
VSVAVSVVVPTFNAAATMELQLASLRRQQFAEPWELIIADDGSTDATVQIASAWAATDLSLRLLTTTRNTGPAAARNRGAAAARGALLLFCDSDDEVGDGWITALARSCDSADSAVGRLEYESLNHPLVAAAQAHPFERPLRVGGYRVGSTACCAVRRDAFEQLGGFDERMRYGEDADFFLRLQDRGYTVADADDAVVAYRLRARLRDVVHQQYRYGEWLPRIFGPARDGQPGQTRLTPARALKRLSQLSDPSARRRLVTDAAYEAGIASSRIRRSVKTSARSADG